MKLASWLEGELDRGAVEQLPPPGLHRLNRAEYANAVRDLLALDMDPATVPAARTTRPAASTTSPARSTMSPALLEAYLRAAGKISRLAIGKVSDADAGDVPRRRPTTTQNYHVEGLPFGTRGGIVDRARVPGGRRRTTSRSIP